MASLLASTVRPLAARLCSVLRYSVALEKGTESFRTVLEGSLLEAQAISESYQSSSRVTVKFTQEIGQCVWWSVSPVGNKRLTDDRLYAYWWALFGVRLSIPSSAPHVMYLYHHAPRLLNGFHHKHFPVVPLVFARFFFFLSSDTPSSTELRNLDLR